MAKGGGNNNEFQMPKFEFTKLVSNYRAQAYNSAKNDYIKIRSHSNDQYVLSQYLSTIRSKGGFSPSKKGSVKRLSGIDPFLLYTLMTRTGDSPAHRNVFNTFNNAQISSLTPEIRLVVRKRFGGKGKKLTSIPLQNIQNKINIFESVEGNTAHIGLKDINISLKGASPETARNDIDASITFYGNTLAAFEKNPIYKNLILPPITTDQMATQKPATESELLLQVGWAEPSPAAASALKFTAVQLSAIRSQFQVFVMGYVSHTFSFNQDGSFILNVDYVSRIDETLITANYLASESLLKRVFSGKSPAPGQEPTDEARKKVSNYIESEYPMATPGTKTRIANALLVAGGSRIEQRAEFFQKKASALGQKELEKLFSRIKYKYLVIDKGKLNLMFLYNCVRRYLPGYSKKQIGAVVQHLTSGPNAELSKGEFLTAKQQRQSATKAITDWITGLSSITTANPNPSSTTPSPLQRPEEKVSYSLSKPSFKTKAQIKISQSSDEFPYRRHIAYTYLGHVVEVFMNALSGQISSRDVQVVLGTLKISVPGIYENKKIWSIYDIPVAEQTLKEVARKIYASKVVTKLTFMSFLKTLMEEVVSKYYLQGDYIFDGGKRLSGNKIRASQMTVTKTTADNLNSKTILNPGLKNDIRSLTNLENPPEMVNLYFVTASPGADEYDEFLDNYVVSSPNSIIKRVNYTQSNLAVMAERRNDNVVNAYRGGDLQILPQVYNTKLDIVGNLSFIPGYAFNLFPNSMGINPHKKDTVLHTLGLLGSFYTISVEHSIGQGGFTTTIDAYNVTVGKFPKTEERVDP